MASINSDLSVRWRRFLKRAKLGDPNGRLFKELTAAYNSGRQYHNLVHILACLRELDSVRRVCPSLAEIEAAIWFHDIVYDVDRKDNEWCSAQVGVNTLACMGMPTRQLDRVEELILDT